MKLARLVEASKAVTATSSRKQKTELLAELLASADPSVVEVAVGFLTGAPRQGRIGVGWATVASVEHSAADEPTLEVSEMDEAIDAVLATIGPGSKQGRQTILSQLFDRATPEEVDFIRRLFTGELRQGALAGVMADAIAKATGLPATLVRRAAMFSGDLGRVAEVALTTGADGLRAIGLEVFRPVQPMLASTASSVEAAVAEMGEASVEWKLDGIRIQVHRSGDDVRIFTRNLNDITGHLPGVVEAVRALAVDVALFDGEAAGAGDPEAFQLLMSSVGRDDEPAHGVVPYLFDVLHVNGADLVDDPLRSRLETLETLVGDLRVPGEVTDDPDVAATVFEQAIAAGHEGVVVKSVSSAYVAGRRGKAWRKVKPHHTLDLVVLGAEWGHGRRRGWLSNLHLGARDADGAFGDTGSFVMVGKTFKGLTDELLGWQTEQLQQLETHRDGITVFVRPAIVVEIALDGVQTSTRYPGGAALRFARVKRYRPDKDPTDADTIETVRGLR